MVRIAELQSRGYLYIRPRDWAIRRLADQHRARHANRDRFPVRASHAGGIFGAKIRSDRADPSRESPGFGRNVRSERRVDKARHRSRKSRNDFAQLNLIKAIMNPVKSLEQHGQAVWLDFLARGFIAEGDLAKLIDDDGVTGVTSNPSIFEKAIGGPRLRRRVWRGAARRRSRRESSLRGARRSRTSSTPPIVLLPVYRRDEQAPTASSAWRCRPISRSTRRARIAEAGGCGRAVDRDEPDDQGAGDRRGHAGDPAR